MEYTKDTWKDIYWMHSYFGDKITWRKATYLDSGSDGIQKHNKRFQVINEEFRIPVAEIVLENLFECRQMIFKKGILA